MNSYQDYQQLITKFTKFYKDEHGEEEFYAKIALTCQLIMDFYEGITEKDKTITKFHKTFISHYLNGILESVKDLEDKIKIEQLEELLIAEISFELLKELDKIKK